MINFAIKWSANDDILILACIKEQKLFMNEKFIDLRNICNTLTVLIHKYGLKIIVCRAAMIYHINYMFLNSDDDEVKELIFTTSQFVSPLFTTMINLLIFIFQGKDHYSIDPIYVDMIASKEFRNGERKSYKVSLIYQISKVLPKTNLERFRGLQWFIKYENSEAINVGDPTKETIIECMITLLNPQTGLCQITEDSLTSEKLFIPYPTKDRKENNNMYYTFGFILGTMFRNGLSESIPFSCFFWNYLANRPITRKDILSVDKAFNQVLNDTRNESLTNQNWVFNDWNNNLVKIEDFSDALIVDKSTVDLYETLVASQKISLLTKYLKIIKSGFDDCLNVKNKFVILSGNLVSFVCQGSQIIDVDELISVIEYHESTK